MPSSSGSRMDSRSPAFSRRVASASTSRVASATSSGSAADRTAASISLRSALPRATLTSGPRPGQPPHGGAGCSCSFAFVVGFALLLERLGAFLGVGGAEDRQPDLELDLQRLRLGETLGCLHGSLHRLYGERAVARDALPDLQCGVQRLAVGDDATDQPDALRLRRRD